MSKILKNSNGKVVLDNINNNIIIAAGGEPVVSYAVNGTATNATINGSASYSGTIEAGGTLTLTLGADGTSYKLPTSISVSGATGTFTRSSDTSGTLVISNPTGDVSFSVVGEPATQPMPVKGQIINLNLDGTVRQYRVLKVNGTQAEVVAMFEANTSIAFNANASCFLTGTKINLADGTTKNIEDITYDDELLVWNFDEGKLDSAKPCWLTVAGLMNNHYYQLTFSDGTILKTTGVNSNHRVYNVAQQKFVGVDKTLVGDAIYSLNGIVTVTDKQYIEEEVEYYNIITSQQFDCFAEGILTSDRYGNMYNIDSDMKWIKDGREIRPYSDYEAVGISEYWYNHLRLGEQNETLEKTVDYINKCESQMRPLNEEE